MALIAFTTISATSVSPVKADWNHPLPKDWYEDLARCETGFNLQHETLSYVSSFGIHRQTWRNWNHISPSKAKTLTFAQQAQAVDRIAFKGKKQVNADGSKSIVKWPVGPWGWGAIRNNCANLATRLCQSKSVFVQRWLKRCNQYK